MRRLCVFRILPSPPSLIRTLVVLCGPYEEMSDPMRAPWDRPWAYIKWETILIRFETCFALQHPMQRCVTWLHISTTILGGILKKGEGCAVPWSRALSVASVRSWLFKAAMLQAGTSQASHVCSFQGSSSSVVFRLSSTQRGVLVLTSTSRRVHSTPDQCTAIGGAINLRRRGKGSRVTEQLSC